MRWSKYGSFFETFQPESLPGMGTPAGRTATAIAWWRTTSGPYAETNIGGSSLRVPGGKAKSSIANDRAVMTAVHRLP